MARRALKSVKGVTSAKVDFDKKEALVVFNPKEAKLDDMVAALKKAGYKGSLKSWPK